MNRLRTTRLVLGGLTAVAAAACTDSPVSKLTARTPSLSAGKYPETEKSAGRTKPLSHEITRSVDVSHKGGRLEIPEVGFRLTIPKNAIRANAGTVHITVTALPGNHVAYDFQPSGITFERPLEFEQDLGEIAKSAETDAAVAPQVSYFKSAADLDPTSGTVRSYEDLPTGVDVPGHTLKAEIWHFSGYIVSWGRH